MASSQRSWSSKGGPWAGKGKKGKVEMLKAKSEHAEGQGADTKGKEGREEVLKGESENIEGQSDDTKGKGKKGKMDTLKGKLK